LLLPSPLRAFANTLYVNAANPFPSAPYTDWSTAATNIQDAVSAASAGDVVLVTNGIYQYGGQIVYGAMSNRVAVTIPLTVQSVNGPAVTTILGYQVPGTIYGAAAVRCAYLTNGAVLAGFTLTNGATLTTGYSLNEQSGGAVWCEPSSAVISNCVLAGNSAYWLGGGAYQGALVNCTLSGNSAPDGGGAYQCTLTNCTLTGNSTYGRLGGGGGASDSTLENCTLTDNSATYGGGTYNCTVINSLFIRNAAGSPPLNTSFAGVTGFARSTNPPRPLGGTGPGAAGGAVDISTLYNCTLVSNACTEVAGGAFSSTLNNCIVFYNSAPQYPNSYPGTLNFCCITPLPDGGTDNITNDPSFVNPAAGDYHLQPNSPCINAGNNSYVTTITDLDGTPRISGGTVDLGAYEFQNPASSISYAWLQQYGFPTDGSADSDGNGMSNWAKWRAGLNPTNPASVLQMLTPSNTASGLAVTWQSVSGITYCLQRAGNLQSQAAFSSIQSNIVGQTATTSFTDTNATGPGPFFYRVGVQ
jgi:hypothetical protein